MKKHTQSTEILLICDNNTAVSQIKNSLSSQMRLPWNLNHYLDINEALSFIEKSHVIILDLGLKCPESSKQVFEIIKRKAAETPIIAITGKKKHGLSTYVMQKGAADILIRGHFEALVRAIEFAIIRQNIAIHDKKTNNQILQDIKVEAETKYEAVCAERIKDLREKQDTLSLFMDGYSATDYNTDDKEERNK